MKEIRFYGRHYPQWREFSNFYLAPIELDGKRWETTEHYYQAMKSLDAVEQEEVRTGIPIGHTRAGQLEKTEPNLTPGFAKKQGRLLLCRTDWTEVKQDVMRKALRAKFAIPALREKLLSTGEDKLIEASPSDYIWGEGADKSGQNLLGVLLMEVRKELQDAAGS